MAKPAEDGLTSSERKARDYLWAGKVKVSSLTPVAVQVEGTKPYTVQYADSVWWCDCPAHITECAHVLAAQRIIDWEPTEPAVSTDTLEVLDTLFGPGWDWNASQEA